MVSVPPPSAFQNGSSGRDVIRAATAGSEGFMLLAGYVDESSGGRGWTEGVALALQTKPSGASPAPSGPNSPPPAREDSSPRRYGWWLLLYVPILLGCLGGCYYCHRKQTSSRSRPKYRSRQRSFPRQQSARPPEKSNPEPEKSEV